MLIITINAIIFFVSFCVIFLKVYGDAARGYLSGLEKKVVFHISKKQVLTIFILLINLLISIIVHSFF